MLSVDRLYIPLRSDITEDKEDHSTFKATLYPTTFRYNITVFNRHHKPVLSLYPTTFRYNSHLLIQVVDHARFLYIPLRSDITLKTISQLGRTKCLYIPLRSDITTESLFVVDVKRVFISHYVQI